MRRRLATILLPLGAVLVVAGIFTWSQATDEADDDRLAARYERAILLDQGADDLAAAVDIDPDAERALPIALLALGGVVIVAGSVALARRPD